MSLVDLAQMREVAEDCGWSFEEIAARYLTMAEEGLAEIAAAIGAGSPDVVRRVAHGLFGTSATCGVEAFEGPFRELEKAGEEARLEDAAAVLEKLNGMLGELRRVLDEAAG